MFHIHLYDGHYIKKKLFAFQVLQNQEVIQYVVHSQQGSNIRNNWYYEEMQLKVFLDLTNTSDIHIIVGKMNTIVFKDNPLTLA